MNVIERIMSFIKKFFNKQEEIKMIEAPERVTNIKEKEDFFSSIKVFRPIQIENNEIETLICIGDGLGIQKNMKY